MSELQKTYDALVEKLKEISVWGSVSAVLGWDERTCMPDAGAPLRSEQSSLLAKMIHERFTSPRIGEMLGKLEGSALVAEALSDSAVNVRETRRAYDRAVKLPGTLVEELARTQVLAEHAWVEARKKSSYAEFRPWLEKILALKKQEAQCIGYEKHAYDALLDAYEPGETTENLRRVFETLRQPLIDLVARIKGAKRQAPVEILERHYPAKVQEQLAREAATAVGFDFKAGRLDVSAHPFSSGIGPGDTRITTRYDERYFGDAFFGVLHEAGHGMYSQGLPAEHFGTPRGEDISLGIHESQSRMWENFVGRSAGFWRFFFPKVKNAVGETLADVSEEEWLFAVNDVRPSLIRTEADEVTYNLHVLLRFELEQAMISGDLGLGDLPGAWNEKMRKYLGITPPDDARGCLQDVHWAGGGIGYFPTYTLGNLYAAQFFEQAKKDLGELEVYFERGEFRPLLDWLRLNIHQHGKKYRAGELVKKVTGADLQAGPLLRHLEGKARELYKV